MWNICLRPFLGSRRPLYTPLKVWEKFIKLELFPSQKWGVFWKYIYSWHCSSISFWKHIYSWHLDWNLSCVGESRNAAIWRWIAADVRQSCTFNKKQSQLFVFIITPIQKSGTRANIVHVRTVWSKYLSMQQPDYLEMCSEISFLTLSNETMIGWLISSKKYQMALGLFWNAFRNYLGVRTFNSASVWVNLLFSTAFKNFSLHLLCHHHLGLVSHLAPLLSISHIGAFS